jgi:quercetin 2,3-dioxygenase
MISVRRSHDRGHANFGWLDSRHTFSFGAYHDPAHMGFGPLRVINDDRVAGGAGFGEHGHADMEIISYVLDGGLAHNDSLGNGSVIRPGDVQRMSAGRGIRHAEFNASESAPVHFLQIWIEPEKRGLDPGYEQRTFDDLDGALRLIGSRDGRDGSVTVRQDIDIYAGKLVPGATASVALKLDRQAWLHVAEGEIGLGDLVLQAGDGAAITQQSAIALKAISPAQILLFDVA